MSDLTEQKNEERRKSERRRSLKKGLIAFNDRYCSTACTVRNESEGGALLMVSQNQVIPSVFELKVQPARDYRFAEVIWRTPDAMGVKYADAASSQVPDDNNWNGVERRNLNRRDGDRRSS